MAGEDYLNTFLAPTYNGAMGVRLPFGQYLEPGARVAAFVHSDGAGYEGADTDVNGPILTTLNSALAYARSGKGDAVFVLPGHAENISSADQMSNLVAGTRIVGVGRGNNRGTFTFSAAAATFLLDAANVEIHNLIFECAGDPTSTTALTVAAPFTVSAAGCGFFGCRFGWGVDANQIVTIGITTTAAADQFRFIGNRCFGAANADATTFLRLVGLDECEIAHNVIVGSTSAAAVGPIQALTTAPTNVNIHHNFIHHNATGGTACITGMAAMTGFISDNRLRNNVDASVAHIPTPGATQLFENYGVNDDGETGILIGTASV